MNLLAPRFKVIAPDTSGNFEAGEIYHQNEDGKFWRYDYFLDCDPSEFPHLFRKLQWWEERTIDELIRIKYVKITTYQGYWAVGDIVPVVDYSVNTRNKCVEWFILKGDHSIFPFNCIPATEAEYNEWRENK